MPPVQAVNHLGIAVRSIDAQRRFYEDTLGAVFEGVEEVADQTARASTMLGFSGRWTSRRNSKTAFRISPKWPFTRSSEVIKTKPIAL